MKSVLRILVTLIAALLTANSAIAGVNNWSRTGPEGGDTPTVAFLPGRPGVAVAFSGDTVLRTDNNGQTWTSHHQVPSGLKSLIPAPNTLDRIIAIGDTQSLQVSNDGGRTFALLNSFVGNIGGPSAVAFSRNGEVIYRGMTLGALFRSADSGASWTLADTGLPTSFAITSIAVASDNPQVVYVSIDRSTDSVFKSIDGGTSWASLHFNPVKARSIAIDPNAPLTVVVGTESGGIKRTTDGGVNWTNVAANNTSIVRFDPLVAGRVYAISGQASPVILQSENSGQTWSQLTQIPAYNVTELSFDSTQSGRMMIASTEGIFGSDDAGVHWEKRNTGLYGGTFGSIVTHPATQALYTTGGRSPAGIFSRVNAQQWSALGADSLRTATGAPISGTRLINVAPSDGNILFAGLSLGIYKSIDGGNTWLKPSTEFDTTTLTALAIDPNNSQIVYAASDATSVMRSNDGGATWHPSATDLTPNMLCCLVIDPVNSQVIYAGSNRFSSMGVFKSVDGGLNWAPANVGIESANVVKIAIDPANTQTLYVATGTGLYKSSNGGASWTHNPVNTTATTSDVAVDPASTNTVIVTPILTQQRSIRRSVDGGATWETITLPTYSPSEAAFDPSTPGNIISSIGQFGLLEYRVSPDLELRSTSSALIVDASQSAVLELRNLSVHGATAVRLVTDLPAGATGTAMSISKGSCTLVSGHGICAVGALLASETVTVTVTLTPTQLNGQWTASLTAYENDPVMANNSVSINVQNLPPASTNNNGATQSSNGGGVVELWCLLGLFGISWCRWLHRHVARSRD